MTKTASPNLARLVNKFLDLFSVFIFDDYYDPKLKLTKPKNFAFLAKFPELESEISKLEKGIYCILVHEYLNGRLGKSVIYSADSIGSISDSAISLNESDKYGTFYWTELIEV